MYRRTSFLRFYCHSRVFQAGIQVETQNLASLQIDARLMHSGMTCSNSKENRYNSFLMPILVKFNKIGGHSLPPILRKLEPAKILQEKEFCYFTLKVSSLSLTLIFFNSRSFSSSSQSFFSVSTKFSTITRSGVSS